MTDPKPARPAPRSKSGKRAPRRPEATVVLSGGAPNSTLMTGAMAGIHGRGKTFDNYYTSGAGGIVALMYLAARDMSPIEAMEATIESSIADPIWDLFHLPYKAFFKPGPFTVPFLGAARMFQLPGNTPFTRLYNDTLDFWAATMTPSFLTPASLGLCQPEPFLAEVIDFDRMRELPGQFYVNAYNITHQRMEEFGKEEIDVPHVWASLAFPFVYEPVSITRTVDGKEEEHFYSEGSDRDPINLPSLHHRIRNEHVDPETTVVLMDVLGSLEEGLVRVPRNLMDAYGISIMTPIVSLARKNKEQFLLMQQEQDTDLLASQGIVRPNGWKPAFRRYRELKFDIPDSKMPFIADWSYSNMAGLFEIGKAAGEKFVDEHGDLLPDID